MKLSHARRAIEDRRVMAERSVRKCPLEKGMQTTSYSCLENPMNSMKRENDRILKEKTPQVGRCPICYKRSVEK